MTIVETTDSDERGMNPVAMTVINHRKEYWPSWGSSQRRPVLKSAMLPTDIWGSAIRERGTQLFGQGPYSPTTLKNVLSLVL